jgi:hypothetical protein
MKLRICGAAFSCILLAHCANSGIGPGDEAPHAPEAEETLRRLVGAMSERRESTASYEQDMQTFLAMRDALPALRQLYDAVPADRTGRWSYVNLAAKIISDESLDFLKSIAHEALPESGHLGDDAEMARFRAAGGIVSGYLAGARGYDDALIQLLSTADASVARSAGVELFSRGKLEQRHAALLTQRGIHAGFTRSEKHMRAMSSQWAAAQQPAVGNGGPHASAN